MTLTTLNNQDWRRFHDAEADVIRPGATVHCVDDAVSIINLCRNRPDVTKFKATGSHWALSTATLSDDEFIELSWPGNDDVPRHTGFDIDLLNLINDDLLEFLAAHPPESPAKLTSDPCLRQGPQNSFVVHIKAGTKVYQAYSLLDSPTVQTDLARRLNDRLEGGPNAGAFDGPWAFDTMGGAGGQTVFGALTTGTHGGDYRQRPMSDSVLAVHLITDGGAHYWIEPGANFLEFQLTDDQKLIDTYDNLVPGVPFEIIRDNDIFNSVVVGGGRFGVVASLVLRVVPQYSLHEHRRLDQWLQVKQQLTAGNLHHVFDSVHFAGAAADQIQDMATFHERFKELVQANRFLQIAVNLSPDHNNDRLCGVTQRWFYPQTGPEATDPANNLRGRLERGTVDVAGKVAPYEPPDDTSKSGGNTTFISRACSDANFVAGALRAVAAEIDQIVADGAVPATGIAVAALGIGAGAVALTIASLCAALVVLSLLLKGLAEIIEALGDATLASTMDKIVSAVLDSPIPSELAVMAIRAIFYKVFMSQQANRDYVALSYAVMDGHDYLDKSCYGNAESIEVFFDASRPDLYCAYVDEILSFEANQQEQEHKFSIGYVSLRYVRGSRGLIAPARFSDTLVVEVAAIRDASGSVAFVKNAAEVARHPIFSASFHWGQFNPSSREEIERQFGIAPGGRLDLWRASLQRLTDGGARDGFSSEFTRKTGLEPF